MYTLLILLFSLVAILMTVAILMQSSKGGGLAASFGTMGGMGGVLGPRGAANFLQKATTILAILYGLICIIIGFIGAPRVEERGSVIQRELQRQQQQQSGTPLPVAPVEEPTQLPPTQPSPSDQENPSPNPQ